MCLAALTLVPACDQNPPVIDDPDNPENPNNPDKRSPHPTLIGGKDPHVACAGILHFKEGKIISVDQESGHFRPHEKSLRKVGKYLKDLCKEHPELFHKESPWRKGK